MIVDAQVPIDDVKLLLQSLIHIMHNDSKSQDILNSNNFLHRHDGQEIIEEPEDDYYAGCTQDMEDHFQQYSKLVAQNDNNNQQEQLNIQKPIKLSVGFIASICFYDLLNNRDWLLKVFQNKDYLQFSAFLTKEVLNLPFKDYALKNIQARILSRQLMIIYKYHRENVELMSELVSEITDIISGENVDLDENQDQVDVSLRALTWLIERIEDEEMIKEFHTHVPSILSAILGAFTDEDLGSKGREQILHIMYLCLRCISWADGIDNELVDDCLNETFNQWMAVFLQIIQADAQKMFDIKRNALKCLTVVFRDFINYSRECINMILRPAWKLMNIHLPIFTETLCYNTQLSELQSVLRSRENSAAGRVGSSGTSAENQAEDNSEERSGDDNQSQDDDSDKEQSNNNQLKGYESDEDNDIEEPHGIKGMTLQLIELLTTLVQRPNVQEVVRQGMNPLLMTVSSYMLVEHANEREYIADENYFLHDKTQSIYKMRNIKNQCVDLFSSLIEIFGDQAITSILLVIDNLLDSQAPDHPRNHTEESKDSSDHSLNETATSSKQDLSSLKEFAYNSSNLKHSWKRKDVATILMGIFIEDIQMYCIRNPLSSLVRLLDEVVSIKCNEAGQMSSYIRGRSLWCASTCCESLITSSEVANKLRQQIIDFSIESLKIDTDKSVKLIATRVLVRYSRKIDKESLSKNASKFETILDELLLLLESSNKEAMHLPIEAFFTFSKANQQTVSKMAPKITPKLLQIFKNEHSEGNLGQDLINLFKLWCLYDECRDIFINTFIPFIMEIIESYYNSTPNEDNKDSVNLCNVSESLSLDSSSEKQRKQISAIDSNILQHVLDLLCTLLKKTDKNTHPEDFKKIVAVFPKLLMIVKKTEDVFLLLHGTAALKNFIFLGHEEILKISDSAQIVEVAKRLLSPQTNETAATSLGNLIIQIFHKIQPEIDTSVLFCLVQKIYKTRIPSTLQSLILVFARLIQTNPVEIVELLSETSVDNRICLKIVLDKWLLQQPLFRGTYTKIVTITALQKLFMLRDNRIESLMVIGYNPSHSNINSEVNTPFKILSTMLRFLDNEALGGAIEGLRHGQEFGDDDQDNGGLGGFKMPRRRELMGGPNERLDTVEGYNDLYDEEEDDEQPVEMMDDDNDQADLMDNEFQNDSEGEDEGGIGRGRALKIQQKKGRLNNSQERIDVNLDDLEDDDDQECLLDYKQSDVNKKKSKDDSCQSSSQLATQAELQKKELSQNDFDMLSNSSSIARNMFKVKESQDKGLADMETGSEVYMSELLAGFDMEDFDDADEQNEEDLMLLGDEFVNIKSLKDEIIKNFREFINDKEQYKLGKEYVQYCVKQLNEDDQHLAKQFLTPLYPKKEAKKQ